MDVHDQHAANEAHFADDEVRFTVSWKADVFANADAAAIHDRGENPLTLDTVVALFHEDLTRRGIATELPTNPLSDQTWISTLAQTYQDPAPRM